MPRSLATQPGIQGVGGSGGGRAGSVTRVESTEDPTTTFERHRGRLFGLAYRMLGQAQDAEDAVQDAYLRWAGTEHASITHPTAWLDRVVTNLCLNRLGSAAARREYIGPWLPEPMLTESTDPAADVERQQAVDYASLVLLERLAPVERAVYVLRTAFGYGHRELAQLLGLTEEGSRQHFRRARQRIEGERRFAADPAQHRRLFESFLQAAQQGDLARLEQLLAEDVVSRADGGGVVTAARRPVTGRKRVSSYLGRGLYRYAGGFDLRMLELNGQPGVVAVAEGAVVAALLVDTADGLIEAVHIVANPAKLRFLDHQLRQQDLLDGDSSPEPVEGPR